MGFGMRRFRIGNGGVGFRGFGCRVEHLRLQFNA